MPNFQFHTRAEILSNTTLRSGEQKLGETCSILNNWEELKSSPAQFIIIGIPEDIGVRANNGIGGTHTAYSKALKALCNVQANSYLDTKNIALVGFINCEALILSNQNSNTNELRIATEAIDEALFPVIQTIVAAHKTPIIIGGGHNNAFPIIKGSSLALNSPINAVNIDAHTDLRSMEGRHSGNGFRYAIQHNFLDKYFVIGCHQNYITQSILDFCEANKEIHLFDFENIIAHNINSETILENIQNEINHANTTATGLEIDLDAIQNTLSSAMGPSGFTTNEVRQYIMQISKTLAPVYLHITEGVAQRADGQNQPQIGKLIAYLITDFIKHYKVSV